MKTITKILVTSLIFTMFYSCSKENDDSNYHAIHGTWNLKNVSGGYAGINYDFESGECVLGFNENNNNLNVSITIDPDDERYLFTGFQEGSHSYYIETFDGVEHLYINQIQKGSLQFSNDTMWIDYNIAVDGFMWMLTKQ